MLVMKKVGVWNIGQDKDSCVVYGMLCEVVEIGVFDEVVLFNDIGVCVMVWLCLLDKGGS